MLTAATPVTLFIRAPLQVGIKASAQLGERDSYASIAVGVLDLGKVDAGITLVISLQNRWSLPVNVLAPCGLAIAAHSRNCSRSNERGGCKPVRPDLQPIGRSVDANPSLPLTWRDVFPPSQAPPEATPAAELRLNSF